ncbi:choline monooxygenase, partial [Coccomyxa subellipsoidea C-169]
QASTPPSSWYTSQAHTDSEANRVFSSSWVYVGHLGSLKESGTFTAGTYMGMPYVLARSADGQLRAFHNVCRHHAAAVALGSGRQDCFTCPYHGWTYGLDGRLRRAPHMRGIENFRAADYGLRQLRMRTWGHFIFLNFDSNDITCCTGVGSFEAQLGPEGLQAMEAAGIADSHLVHVASQSYTLQCNWKVFCDNYLDGGYHVSIAHPDLAAGLDLTTYSSTIYESCSIQSCQPKNAAKVRLGEREAAYAFVYPNLMINRYGPWMDTNLVLPDGPRRCTVHFEYWLEQSLVHDSSLIDSSLADSDQVQQEDIALCEAVQRGLHSPAYDTGRYAPGLEQPMFHFHKLLQRDLMGSAQLEA